MLPGFVRGQTPKYKANKNIQKKNFASFPNHFPLLTMTQAFISETYTSSVIKIQTVLLRYRKQGSLSYSPCQSLCLFKE